MDLQNIKKMAPDALCILPGVQQVIGIPLALAYAASSVVSTVKACFVFVQETNKEPISYSASVERMKGAKEELVKNANNTGINVLRAIPIVGTVYSIYRLYKLIKDLPPVLKDLPPEVKARQPVINNLHAELLKRVPRAPESNAPAQAAKRPVVPGPTRPPRKTNAKPANLAKINEHKAPQFRLPTVEAKKETTVVQPRKLPTPPAKKSVAPTPPPQANKPWNRDPNYVRPEWMNDLVK